MSNRLRLPPSSLTGELRGWCDDVWRAVNGIPAMSYFSGTFPSSITGVRGDIAVNAGNLSSASILFIHDGSRNLPDTTSWRTVA